MRRIAFTTVLLCLGWIFAASVMHARPASPEDEVMAAEHARVQALLNLDYAVLDKVMADDLIFCHASGMTDTKMTYLAAMHSDVLHYYAIDGTGMKLRMMGDKAAVLNGPVTLKVRNRTPEPRELKLQATAVYEKRDGRWQLISYQTTALPGAVTFQPVK
jgi:uncharacterized protein (TIGR02246 family)